jgi:hypothetical protein
VVRTEKESKKKGTAVFPLNENSSTIASYYFIADSTGITSKKMK